MARDAAYREAKKRIEEARHSKATGLDLSSMTLTELPESLGQLTQLQELKLSSNRLTALPESLGQLTQLQVLNISYNQLTALPESLGQLTQLLTLNLSRNQIAVLSPKHLSPLTNLRSLDLSSNPMESLPHWLGEITRLESLALNHLKLTEAPAWLVQLKSLNELEIADNSLTTLPSWLCQLKELRALNLSSNMLTRLPEWLDQLSALELIWLVFNPLAFLPLSIGNLEKLREIKLYSAPLKTFPEVLRSLKSLQLIWIGNCGLTSLPDWIYELRELRVLSLDSNELSDLPPSLGQLEHIQALGISNNPLNPELAAAHKEGVDAVMRYLRAKAGAQVVLNEAKLILIGEGEVGKSCLLSALRGDDWLEGRPTTHGIEIKPVKVTHPDTGTDITLNGWDFGGQRVYRPTHQLFFSAPAVYLVVWKPREGQQQGSVKEWIKLVKHREPDAKILVVATHGGPGQRQPDVDRQEIWDLFGRDMVLDFLHVNSKPDEKEGRLGIARLIDAIARVAASLPEVGRKVPARWQQAREALQKVGAAYLPIDQVLEVCREHKMDEEEARLFVSISHRLGYLIYYEHDPILRDIVVLKPDWLATAISFVLDDKHTRDAHGLVSFDRLTQLWNDQERAEEFRYPSKLHPVFLKLMERFDLSYRVSGLPESSTPGGISLIAQLVPDIRPEHDVQRVWTLTPYDGDEQQMQICRIVDAKSGQSAPAEGLFYQLIVRLHKFSLGRDDYRRSIHWQRGLVLDDEYNGRALLEHIGNDVRITVRAPLPVTFLSVLTHEVRWLVENFWEGLRCEVVVPCVEPCGKDDPGLGVFEVEKLIAFKRQGMIIFPCFVTGCNQAQDIDQLLRNAPSARRTSVEQLLAQGFDEMRSRLDGVRQQLNQQDRNAEERFRVLDLNDRRAISQVEDAFRGLIQMLLDEAKEGPRLFSLQPADPGFFDKPTWINQKFRLTLWCEHSRLPLPGLNGKGDKRGMYDLNLPREWFVKAAPFLKVVTGTLSLVLPVASSATKLLLDDKTYKGIEKELDLGQKSIDSVLKGGEKVGGWLGRSDAPDLEHGEAVEARGAILRQLHAWLKEKDPSFGGLIRVRNKRQEFLWVHPQFEKEY